MRTNFIIGALLILFSIGCKAPTPLSTGKFFEGKTFDEERYFVHEIKQAPNHLVKITDQSGYGYYSWKAVKYLHTQNNDAVIKRESKLDTTKISVYKTVTNKDLHQFKNEELAYIRKDKKVRINNLYFIDDYRCIYLSFDDDRTDEAFKEIPLFFDQDNYKVRKKDQKRYEQYLRGYYQIKDDRLFINFENAFSPNENFFIEAIIENKGESIVFKSISIPNTTSVVHEDGYNANLITFGSIFHPDAQPVFETVESVSDLIFVPQNYISTGFELVKNDKKLNNLHQKLLKNYKGKIDKNDVLIISKITYTFDEACVDGDKESYGYRTYYMYKLEAPGTMYTVHECLGLNEVSEENENMIATW